ncbi:MAG: hypothetical protein WCY07_13045 [Pigmentiphaga sp.]
MKRVEARIGLHAVGNAVFLPTSSARKQKEVGYPQARLYGL